MENLLECSPEDYLSKESSYVELLNNYENWRKIPLMNYVPLHEIKDLTLVRFRGMIQDMLDPEIYLENYEVISNTNGVKRLQQGKYRDCLVLESGESVNYDSHSNIRGERRSMFIVSIPGLNDWAIDFEKNVNRNQLSTPNESLTSHVQSHGQKRSNEDEQMETGEIASVELIANKRIKSNEMQSPAVNTNRILSAEYLINSPITDRPSKACIVKVYKDFDSYVLNTVVDMIGFLSVDPNLDGSTEEPSEFDDINEMQAKNPPPSLIPRLHVVAIRTMKHLNPLLDQYLTETSIYDKNNMENVHKDLKIILTQCLFGDTLAAEYLLSHLISSVYGRTDLETIGQFSLNLCNIPSQNLPSYTEQLYEIIELLLPASHYLPMSLENMNEKQFVPEKDYETNKLKSGLLQLAPHTHLILDETRLQSGKLESNGVFAVQNIANLINNQQVRYNFKYYELNFNTDIPVLVLSEGKSMLPSNVQIPINIDPECFNVIDETLKAAKHYLQTKLNVFRMYLTYCKICEFSMKPSDTEMIEKDFVEMRKANANVGAESLHKLLVLSRLLGIARGKTILDEDCWEMAKNFEKSRLIRLDKIPKRVG